MNRRYIHSHIVCWVLILIGGRSAAQNSQVRAYTLTEGLPQSQVFDVVQDRLGYLWLGTQGGGLSSFDGERFRVWRQREGLISNYIHALEVMGDELLIGTRKGVSVKSQKGFLNFPGPQIHAFCSIDSGVYVATQSGVQRFDRNDGLQKCSLHPQLDRTVIYDIASDGEFLWVASGNGWWRMKMSENGKLSQGEKVQNGDFRSVVCVTDKVMGATFSEGIFAWDRKEQTVSLASPLTRINHLAHINEHQLWVSTDNAGVWVLDAATYQVLQKVDKASGMSVLHIRKCLKDRQANIWIASSGGGLYKYAANYFHHFDKEAGLAGNRVYAVHAMNDGIIASNSEAGLVKIDSTEVRPWFEGDPRFRVKIKTIASDTSGHIWVGTEGQGIRILGTQLRDSMALNAMVFPFRLDTVQVEVPVIHTLATSEGLVSDWIREVYPTPSQVWVASYSSGIMRFQYDFEQDSVYAIQAFGRRKGMGNVQINDIQLDSLGRMWYGTRKGHLGYIAGDRVNHLGNVLGDNSDITRLLFAGEYLFVGTAGNGIWWTSWTDSLEFHRLEGNKELYSNNIYQLIFDDNGYLWVGSERGLDKLKLNASNQIVELFHYGRNDGFLGIETCLNAVDKDAAGNLWFGTINGLTQYQPTEKTAQHAKLLLEFEEVEILYQPLDSIDVNEWAATTRVLNLAPRQNHLAFRYRTIDLNHPEEVAYRWRLNGADWSPWSRQNSIHFAGLSHGDYVFEVQSRNREWDESEVLAFRFYITQPLYEKTGFRRLVGGMLLLLLVLGFWGYLRRVKRKNKQEKERLELENHLLSLEQKALRLQMNPHFVFNVLNGIKATGTSKPEKMNTTINQFATLMRAILNNSRQDTISLDQEMKTLENYIHVEQLTATKEFTYTLVFDSEMDPEEVLIPPMLVQPFVENAIRHGIMAVKRPGKLGVRFWVEGECLHCAVEDNGIGIHQSHKNKTTPHNHHSLALEVTKERIVSLSGKQSLHIQELVSPAGSPAGTRVEFNIPLVMDY